MISQANSIRYNGVLIETECCEKKNVIKKKMMVRGYVNQVDDDPIKTTPKRVRLKKEMLR